MQVLQAVGLEPLEVLHAGAGRLGARHGSVVGDALGERRGADGARVRDRGARGLDRVDDEAHVAVLDHVDDVRPPLGHLVHRRQRDAVRGEHLRGAARGGAGPLAWPRWASGLKPSWTRSRAMPTAATLSPSRTLMNARPPCGSLTPAAICDFTNASPKVSPTPITSPVDFISGPRMVSTPGNLTNGNTASFTEK